MGLDAEHRKLVGATEGRLVFSGLVRWIAVACESGQDAPQIN